VRDGERDVRERDGESEKDDNDECMHALQGQTKQAHACMFQQEEQVNSHAVPRAGEDALELLISRSIPANEKLTAYLRKSTASARKHART
jgi:hypothetical protein